MQEPRLIYAAIDNRSALPDLTAYPAGGINAAPLEIVCFRDIAAVVSAIDIEQFAPATPDELLTGRDTEHHQAHLLKYLQVNTFLLAQTGDSAMLPLKFGFTARDNATVARVLEQAYIQLRSYLDRLQGKMELVIQVSWNLPKILQAMVSENPGLMGDDPTQTGRVLFEAAEHKKDQMVAAIHAKLGVPAQDYSDAPLKTEAMIFNRSYLVGKDQKALFDDAVDEVATLYEDISSFRYIGPLPVYSFVNIELNQGNFTMVDKSRRLLQLPEQASWENIKSAYRQLILAHHPDRNPDDAQAAQRTNDVVAAFAIVKAYYQSLSGIGKEGKHGEISFSQQAVEQAIILDDKGAVLARWDSGEKPA